MSAGACIPSDEHVQLSCELPGTDRNAAPHNDLCSYPSVTHPASGHHHAAKVRGELLRFQPGDYTLVTDHDLTATGGSVLDLILHFCCDGR